MGLSTYDFIFITFSILWILEFVFFPKIDKLQERRKSTFLKILYSILTIVFINGILFYFHIGVIESKILSVFALVFYGGGLLLRYWALILLGKFFSRNVQAHKDQELISTGPYTYIRHPSYLGLFLLTVSIPLYTRNMIVFPLSIIWMFKVLNKRIKEEETLMTQNIGERYSEWKEKRYRFLPFIY